VILPSEPQRLGDDGFVPRPALRPTLLVGVLVAVAQVGDQKIKVGVHEALRG
jgi:hypothetical protein